ncbi:aryl-alcohol dehydrogenase [Aspergillus heteromorphus CBS 117.55]|uniref:Aryl-alcohol dehydrogenase n=1 Tax=Aspergillus heteromorphus CBS 117.55 TaxID=1448321 RepID=A0A317WR49_9EURO|nr:aryl-alcohol dehydrogenase [Aspergillus heteromorphus CBS 117.55]PWY88913.1 aryl-alcohol dehydrogenase [Aspergillus heteromorphus CBS 117.55]
MDAFAPAPPPPTPLGRYRILSSTAGIRVSPLQLGAMSIGSAWSSALGTMSKESSFSLLDAYTSMGGNFIDTCNNYQNGESESWLGEWMSLRGNRDQLVLSTKYTGEYAAHSIADGKGKTINHSGNHRRSLHMSVRDSLRKLGTEYIDILYVHWWDYTTSVEEVMDSLHYLVERGQVLYLGICNAPAWVVSEANVYARMSGKTQFSIYQGRWNVMVRDLEREVIPMARRFGMAIAPWDAVGGGRLQSKGAMEERRRKGEGVRDMMGSGAWQTEQEVKMSEALEQVAGQIGDVSVTAVALAYLMAKTTNVFPLVGGRKVEHLRDNIKALEVRLSEDQVRFLEGVNGGLVKGFPYDMLGEEPGVSGGTGPSLANAGTVDCVRYSRAIGYE